MAVRNTQTAWARRAIAASCVAGLLGAAVIAAPGQASAQSGIEGLSGFDQGLAPGYQSPEFETRPIQREPLQPFGVEPGGDFLDTDTNAPINEFAGQTRRYDPGLIGGLLGAAKNRLLGRD